MAWTPEEKRRNAIDIMKSNIDSHPVGRKLTPEARQRAAEFAADAWQGQMGNGTASELGIKHVTSGVLKDDK